MLRPRSLTVPDPRTEVMWCLFRAPHKGWKILESAQPVGACHQAGTPVRAGAKPQTRLKRPQAQVLRPAQLAVIAAARRCRCWLPQRCPGRQPAPWQAR